MSSTFARDGSDLSTSPIMFILLLAGAFVLSYIPIVNWPFSWMMTFFHEISHGIAALVTGGSIASIQLHLRGSGLCTTVGGIGFSSPFQVIWALLSGVWAYISWQTSSISDIRMFHDENDT